MNNTHSSSQNSTGSALGWSICTIAAVFYCYEYLLRITPSVMMEPLRASFGLNAYGLGVLIGLYYMIYSPMQAIVGILHDLYGPRRILTAALVACIIGNLVFSTTHSVYIAGVGRLLIGFGSAFAFVGVLKLAANWLPANRFAMIAGLATSLGMLGGMFGNIGLMAVVQASGWRATLHIGTVIGIVLLPIVWFVVRDKPKDHASYIQHTLTYRELFINLFIIVRNPQLWICGVIGSMLYASLSIFAEAYGNEFIHAVYHYSYDVSARLNSMIYFGWLIGGPLVGWLSDRIRQRRSPILFGGFLAAIVCFCILYVPQLPLWTLYVLLFLFGVFCSAENICFAIGREASNPRLAGTGVAFINMVIMLAGMIFQPLVGRLLDMNWHNTWVNGMRSYTAHDYRIALTLIPIGLIVATLLSLILRETHARIK